VLDLQTEQHDQGQHLPELYEEVAHLKRRHDLHPCAVRPRDGLALRRDGEREVVQDLVKRFRDLPADQRRRLPALLNSLAQLEIVVGELEEGQQDFQEVARLAADPLARAEAHHNVYRAALERRDWAEALAALRRATALDAGAFAPFPPERFEPVRVLGAGGFGVTFLCEEPAARRQVVIKALRPDSLERDAGTIFRETGWLQELDHPALLRVYEFGYAGPEGERPYLVLEHCEGETLAEYVARNGPLAPEDWLPIAWQVARALQAAHGRGVLHRCLQPAGILLRHTLGDDVPVAWQVKVMDTGLSLKRAFVHASASHREAAVKTALGRSVARAVAYAPPEAVGRPKGQVWVGPHSDVYSFGRLCAFALTGRPDPDGGDLVLLPEAWRELLGICCGWTIAARPPHFGAVLDRLSGQPGTDGVVKNVDRALHAATIACHSAALLTDPDNLEAYVRRANAHARQGDFGFAVADYTKALELRPTDAALLRSRALAHAHNKDFDKAIADYTEALRLEPRNAEAHANRGLAYAQRDEHDKAILDYTEAIGLNPRDEALYYNRGNAHCHRGEYDRAVADYTEVLRRDPRHYWALTNRGKAHALRGDAARAVADFTCLLQLDPRNLRALWDRALAYRDLGRHDKAVADFTAALALEPSAALYADRGLARASDGDLQAAVHDFTEALTLDPDYSAAYLFRGNARHDLGEFEPAVADLTEAVRLNPDSAPAHFHRGQALARLDRLEEAIADYTRAAALEPNHMGAYFHRAAARSERGEYDEAVADYTAALKVEPHDAATLTNRGNALGQLGEYDKALADYTAALGLEPDDALTLTNRGNTYAQLGEHDKALADYAEAIRHDPTNAHALACRGNLYAGLGDFSRAAADYTEVIRLEPEFVAAYFHRGNALSELGELDRAAADYAEALRLQPDHAAALNNRGNVYRRLGELDKAQADFTAAIAADSNFSLPYFNRGNLYADRGDLRQALDDFGEAIRLAPHDLTGWHNRGRVHAQLGEHDKALADNLEALKLAPDDAQTCNNLAWLWAVCPRLELRDVGRAVEFARKACEKTEWKEAGYLDTLAVALAAAGQFEEAVRWQRQAVELCRPEERADYEARLALYEAGKPYQETIG
jgi:tetratricopeptide (TPR) repeat protein